MARLDESQIDAAMRAGSERGRRAWVGTAAIVAVVALLFVGATRMVPHPLGAARTYGKYHGKAITTVKGALSDVETVSLAASAAQRGDAFGPYTSAVVSEAEDRLSSRQSSFDSIQPPDVRADDLHQQVDQLLNDALDHVRDVRVAARRGELRRLADIAQPLEDDAKKLNRFTQGSQ